eukprot:6454835-Amphidinium_carterae.1
MRDVVKMLLHHTVSIPVLGRLKLAPKREERLRLSPIWQLVSGMGFLVRLALLVESLDFGNPVSVGVVTHSFVCNGHEHTSTWILKDHLRENDVHCGIHHCGVKGKPAWHKNDRSRSYFWSSIRAQLPLGVEDLITESADAGPCASSHSQATCSDGERARRFPLATAETHALKRRRYSSTFA